MKVLIDYSKLEEPARSTKAIQDAIKYLGRAEFERITKLIADQPKRDIINGLSLFVGIQGFLAQVLADWCGVPENGPSDYIVTLCDVERDIMAKYEMRIENQSKAEAMGYAIVQHHRKSDYFDRRVDKVTVADNNGNIIFDMFC